MSSGWSDRHPHRRAGDRHRGSRAARRQLDADHVWVTHWHPLKKPGRHRHRRQRGRRGRHRTPAHRGGASRQREGATRQVRRASASSPTISASSPGPPTARLDQLVQPALARLYRAPRSTRCRAGAGSTVHHPDHVDRVVGAFATASPPARRGRTHSRCAAATAAIAGSCRARCRSATSAARWFAGSAPTPTSPRDRGRTGVARGQRDAGAARRDRDPGASPDSGTSSQDLLAWSTCRAHISASIRRGPRRSAGRNRISSARPPSRWCIPTTAKATRAEIGQLVAGGRSLRFESRFRHHDGAYHWISWKAVPDETRIYSMGQDITELKEAENELREARRELAQVARRTILAAATACDRARDQATARRHRRQCRGGPALARAQAAGLGAARTTLTDIVADGHRASEVIQSVRAMFGSGRAAGSSRSTSMSSSATPSRSCAARSRPREVRSGSSGSTSPPGRRPSRPAAAGGAQPGDQCGRRHAGGRRANGCCP